MPRWGAGRHWIPACRRLDVLVEGADPRRPGFVRGTACRYVPVVCRGHAPALLRRRIPVRAVSVEDGVVLGEPEAEDGISSTFPHETRIALPLLSSPASEKEIR